MRATKSVENASNTQLHATIAALEQSQERLKLALESSMMVLWEWDVVQRELYWSDEMKKLYGLSTDETVSYESFLDMVHPDDREYVSTFIKRQTDSGEFYQFEHRIVWPDGSTHWVLGKGRSFLMNGRPVRMIGTSTNIDSIKQAQSLAEANALLKKQRTQLMALNKTKDEFIALASHQLRTPATAVKQYTSLLLNDFAGPLTVDQEQLLQIAYNSNERQLNIINDLLKTAQIDSKLYKLEKTEQDIAKVIETCINDLKETLESRRQHVVVTGLTSVKLKLDMSEIKLVIMNLLENASKYSYPGTTVNVVMKHNRAWVSLAITDKGVGISPADHKLVFEKFTRVNNELSDTVNGNGFGLYWVKRLVALHGGSIKLTSELGIGSTFTIRLPI